MRCSRHAIVALSVASLTGCGSMVDYRRQGYRTYGGVREDFESLTVPVPESVPTAAFIFLAPLIVADLPLSFAADTVHLAYWHANLVLYGSDHDKDIISGIVLEDDVHPGWREVGLQEAPVSQPPLKAELTAVADWQTPLVSQPSNDDGHYTLKVTRPVSMSLRWIRVTCEGYEPLEIGLGDVARRMGDWGGVETVPYSRPGENVATTAWDTAYWRQHRLEIRLRKLHSSSVRETTDHDRVATWTRVLEKNPNNFTAYYQRGIAKARKRDYDGAMDDYARALEIHPKSPLPHLGRAEAEKETGDLNAALAECNTAVELAPKSAPCYETRGEVKAALKDLDGAISDYSRALELLPSSSGPFFASVFYHRGLAKQAKGDPDGAKGDYRKALRFEPLNADIRNASRALEEK